MTEEEQTILDIIKQSAHDNQWGNITFSVDYQGGEIKRLEIIKETRSIKFGKNT